MATVLLVLAVAVALALLGLLAATLLVPSLRIWPPPGPGTWQSYVWWWLFRALNVLCFAVAATAPGSLLGLPLWLKLLAAIVLAASVGLFVYAFLVLGRDNSYGASDGLVTGGVYRWTRNPQNAMLIVVYGALAIAADNGPTCLVCGAMMAVYAAMVLAEEPWLAATYGDAYAAYRREVPRFFHWRRAVAEARRLWPAAGRRA